MVERKARSPGVYRQSSSAIAETRPGSPAEFGNFIRDALAGGPIIVKGDGSSVRSYLYAADMAAWLWTILIDGPPGRAFNVGSEEAISIGDLARQIGSRFHTDVQLGRKPLPGAAPGCYLPTTIRSESELALRLRTPLHQGIERMAGWCAGRNSANLS